MTFTPEQGTHLVLLCGQHDEDGIVDWMRDHAADFQGMRALLVALPGVIHQAGGELSRRHGGAVGLATSSQQRPAMLDAVTLVQVRGRQGVDGLVAAVDRLMDDNLERTEALGDVALELVALLVPLLDELGRVSA